MIEAIWHYSLQVVVLVGHYFVERRALIFFEQQWLIFQYFKGVYFKRKLLKSCCKKKKILIHKDRSGKCLFDFCVILTFQRNLQKEKKADMKKQYQDIGHNSFNLFRPPVSQSAFGWSYIITTTITPHLYSKNEVFTNESMWCFAFSSVL